MVRSEQMPLIIIKDTYIIMKKNVSYLLGCCALSASLFSCSPKTSEHQEFIDPLVAHIDTTVRPQDDFWSFANGQWFKENPIPSSEKENGIFTAVADTVKTQVLELCKSLSGKDFEKGSNEQKIGDLYYSGMDSVNLNKKGLSELKDYLGKIDQWSDMKNIGALTAYLSSISGNPLFSFYVGQDDMNSNAIAISLGQGGTSLPSKNYYFNQDEQSKAIRDAFVTYIKSVFQLMGYDVDKAEVAAKKQLEIETAMAKASRNPEDMRDPYENYHKMAMVKIGAMTPLFDFVTYFKEAGLEKVDTVIVGQPEFFTALNTTLRKYSVEDWKNFMKFMLVDGYANYLNDDLYMKSFNFYSKTLNGIPEPQPRWKRVVNTTNRTLGDLVGQVYVEKYLPRG